MENITVDKAELKKTLETNREKHRQTFLTAQEVFRTKVIETLDERLRIAREGGRIDLLIMLPEPQDYTESFDRAISMVDWAQGDSITLSEKDFQRYVLNDWEWARAFAASTQAYVQ